LDLELRILDLELLLVVRILDLELFGMTLSLDLELLFQTIYFLLQILNLSLQAHNQSIPLIFLLLKIHQGRPLIFNVLVQGGMFLLKEILGVDLAETLLESSTTCRYLSRVGLVSLKDEL
jgi:hypothetical protein